MADRYEDEDEFDREVELEDEDGFEDEVDLEDGPEDEDEDEVIHFGPVNRQEAEAKARRIQVEINDRVYKFLPADQWSYRTWKAVDVDKGRLPDFERWARGVLPKGQIRSFLALDLDLNQYTELLNQIQKRAEGKVKAAQAKARRARRSGDPRKRAR